MKPFLLLLGLLLAVSPLDGVNGDAARRGAEVPPLSNRGVAGDPPHLPRDGAAGPVPCPDPACGSPLQLHPPRAAGTAQSVRQTSSERHSVTISVGDASMVWVTQPATVGAVLAMARVGLGPLDAVTPDLETWTTPDLRITVTQRAREVEISEEVIPFGTVWEGDEAVPIDSWSLVSQGTPGLQRYRHYLVKENGVEVARTLREAWMARPPMPTRYAYGKGITRQVLVTDTGETIAYWRRISMRATSYSAARAGTPRDAPWYGYTFSGEPMRNGVVAADLSILPLRTRVYVPGYGHGEVLDKGGGVVGRHIDLGYTDEDWVSWYSMVDVYLLWPPPSDPSLITWILPER